jgi:hypothetical protein
MQKNLVILRLLEPHNIGTHLKGILPLLSELHLYTISLSEIFSKYFQSL